MPDLLHVQERDRLLGSLRRMLRQVNLDGQPMSGLAHSIGANTSLRTLDNAIAAELMAIPALRAADATMADAVFSFVAAMAEEAGPPPRGVIPPAAPRAEILRGDPRDLRVLTPWHEYTGDLTHGVLRQRLRGEGRDADVLHTGNMARLRLQGGLPGLLGRFSLRARTLDIEENITGQGVQAEGSGVLMWHESTLRLSPMPGITVQAGTVRYEYRVSGADPVLRLTVVLRAGQKAGLTGVRLTTALDALSERSVAPAHVSVGRSGSQSRRPPGPFPDEALLAQGAIDSLHLWQAGPEDEALALHIRPRAGEQVFSARLHARQGVPHWLVLRHAMPDVPRGGTATLREDRLLARGVAPGAPEAALRLLRNPEALAGRDPGQAGLGAPLAAMASVLLNAPGFNPPLSRDRAARLREALDRQLAALPDEEGAALPVAELASLALGLDAVWRGGGLPREGRRLRQVLGQLVAAASPEGAVGQSLAEHGAAILAIARAATLLPEPWLLEALHRAVMALNPDGPALAGVAPVRPVPTRALAALLRGVRAVELVARTGRVDLDAGMLARAAEVRDACLQALSGRLRAQEDRLEVLPGEAGEPDAPSTAALLLAVLSPDEVALTAGGVAA
ncbi:hypothetical protein J8J14_06105 [Roseomonas sp. SSH11]|uniref:Uncharacterized protein n=1 Tax=Pararoseomonas baculiformis TaxID=2820812 RepID=A0ABS4ABG1_9PROT|nr:hypothetical protein [Pararoseomonas baculiformis]MBP0444348.1 hypothetical protein [Pararoseomonas baculiformis]